MGNHRRKEVAELLKVSQGTLYRWERDKKIPRVKRLKRTGELLYTDEDIEKIRAFMETVEDPAEVGAEESAWGY